MSLNQQVAAAVIRRSYFWIAHEYRTGYSQDAYRRWSGILNHVHWHDDHDVPPYADCSSAAYWLAWDARCAVLGKPGNDIMGGDWRWGNTTTLKEHGKRHSSRTSTDLWVPGRTLVFYEYPTAHVTVYLGSGVVFSHGRSAGPELRRFNYRTVSQARLYSLGSV